MNNMTYERAKIYLKERGQGQLLKYYDELSEIERAQLLNDIEKVNFNIIKNIDNKAAKKRGKITPLSSAVSIADIKR
ncbi:MAG: UDPGP type 1 family protein, partial [Clostridia bacterium]|nr:UDPGP type 1 family protein [Clostridia bacterium]